MWWRTKNDNYQVCHRYAINIFSQASYIRNWSNRGRRVRNVWWLIFYCLAAQILKVIVGFWRRQSLIPSEQIVPVWGKNGGYVKNYQLSRERLINLGRYPSKQSCKNKKKICPKIIMYVIKGNMYFILILHKFCGFYEDYHTYIEVCIGPSLVGC